MTTALAGVARVGVPFVWLGAVLAISFLETPLKFRAPGITLPLGLGIGRLVFRALNLIELALGVILTVAVLVDDTRPASLVPVMVGVVWVLLAVQMVLVGPRLDRRTRALLAGDTPPRSWLHLGYIAAEIVKVLALLTLGSALALAGLPA